MGSCLTSTSDYGNNDNNDNNKQSLERILGLWFLLRALYSRADPQPSIGCQSRMDANFGEAGTSSKLTAFKITVRSANQVPPNPSHKKDCVLCSVFLVVSLDLSAPSSLLETRETQLFSSRVWNVRNWLENGNHAIVWNKNLSFLGMHLTSVDRTGCKCTAVQFHISRQKNLQYLGNPSHSR